MNKTVTAYRPLGIFGPMGDVEETRHVCNQRDTGRDSNIIMDERGGWYFEGQGHSYAIDFCPYCGERLPKPEKKAVQTA